MTCMRVLVTISPKPLKYNQSLLLFLHFVQKMHLEEGASVVCLGVNSLGQLKHLEQ